jgi:hypothetical protein
MTAGYTPAGFDSLEVLGGMRLDDARRDLHAVEDAIYERCLPLVGMTREQASERISAVIGTRAAAPDDLRRVAALFGLTITNHPRSAA